MNYVVPVSDAQRELARRAGQPVPDDFREVVENSEEEVEVVRCAFCGWWVAWSPYLNTGGHIMHEFGYGQLRALDPADIGEPVDAIRSFLAANYDRRLDVDPRKFEELVCSVFSNVGYRARLTAYSGDGGIDVFLDGPSETLIGVQVKRWKHAIKVEQINALTGALLIHDCTAGVFVTTSEYQRGAVVAAQKASARGFPN
jgi:restriction system protein